MRRQLNTLYITTEGAWLRKDGANIVMEVEGKERARLPIHMLESLVCFGRVLVSPPLMGFCAEQGVTITHLTPYGKFLARIEGPVSGNVLLRRTQYRVSDDETGCAAIVRGVLIGKVHNQRVVLSRGLRDYGAKLPEEERARLEGERVRMSRIARDLLVEPTTDRLRGLEGEAAQRYFSVFDLLIRHESDAFRFTGRNRRPPRDCSNALLSFLYTLLTHDCRSALESVGLDPAVGFLHRDRPGRPSLALDLAEEFRPLLGDRLALSLINRRQLREKDFIIAESGGVTLTEEARKTVLTAYQERKREELNHTFIGEKAPIGMLPFLQAQLLARHIRGDLDAYPPFLWK
ncbi:type I-C CRISPR-associated endonuclease Cas1c [Chromohalobacter canadensis]|uniref:CRISPR-associated endonuclease Cas1 n=1 Tax=Chromohalobacter canadensis TaxID=141389 RepID=A0ABZ0YGI8_9GAMM|nr:type I-C CRISPR-associated endonuclease Cas1c [Chromohalobacter canadensis]MCK0769622.1 type I-C CRISPR-associated endonuclease Cas1c [Chromohalobacter canadensis]WQH10402.1 type I-C CRISPR-associated endonuclease Cas1c [Chromohalobacter canadensis]